MAKSSLLLTLSHISTIQLEQPGLQRLSSLPPCQLKWRSNQLWVKAVPAEQTIPVPAVRNEEWLTECLKRSSVRIVCLDAKLGDAAVRQWADIASAAKKQVFIRLPQSMKAKANQAAPQSFLEQIAYQTIASILLVGLLPLMLLIAGLLYLECTSVFHSQWSVGRRGQLFQLWQFQTQRQNRVGDISKRNPLQDLIYASQFYRLPGLINTARGETRLGHHSLLKISMLGQLKSSSPDSASAPDASPLSLT